MFKGRSCVLWAMLVLAPGALVLVALYILGRVWGLGD